MGPEVVLGMQAAGAVMGAAGNIQQGRAASSAAKYQAQVARNNATIARQNMEYASQAGEVSAQAQDLKNRAIYGGITAAQSASGISFDSPSLYDVREGAAQIGRFDTANVAANAALRARSYETQATGYEAEAALDERKASDVATAGYLGAAGSLLSGASGFAAKWDRYYSPTATATKPFYTGDA